LKTFERSLQREFIAAVMTRLGLASRGSVLDGALVQALWTYLRESAAPYEQAFFDLRGGRSRLERLSKSPSRSFYASAAFAAVRERIEAFEPDPGARVDHPYFDRSVACTLLIEEVEAIWKPIADRDDWSVFRDKLAAIEEMREAYALP
jgi:uncharacterized protein YdiU (UPF0061 family)